MVILNRLNNMSDDFNPENAVAVTEDNGQHQPATSNFNVDNAIPVDSTDKGQTHYDDFKAAPVPSVSPTDDQTDQGKTSGGLYVKASPKATKTPQEGNIKTVEPEDVKSSFSYPYDHHLNAMLDSAVGAMWNTVVKPITGKDDKNVDAYLDHLNKNHPIAATIGGTAPYIASSVIFPEALIPNVWSRMAVQFGAISGMSAIGQERTTDAMKPITEKIAAVSKETLKGAAYSPIFAASQKLQFINRPFATALTRAGVIGAGSATMSAFFGDNITQAFKQGGILGALSLITESPHLANTVIGRGIVNHANSVYADLAVKSGLPDIKMDPEHPDFQKQVMDVATGLSSQIKGIDKPQIVAAAVKLDSGAIIEGSSHDDALTKIGESKDSIKEHKPLPKVDLKSNETNGTKVITDKNGKQIGTVGFSDKHPEEGVDLKIDKDFQGKGYGKGTVDHIFNSGIDTIYGDVGKDNKQGQDFWKHIGGKLQPNEFGNFRLTLTKEDFKKATSGEGKYQAGFTIIKPDGSRDFIGRAESMEAPYNLKTGHSEDVPGLNESKFMPQPEPLEIVNPETLRGLNESGQMDVNLIPGVAESAEILAKSHAELKEKFAPYTVGEEGKITAQIIRENLGVLARSQDRLEKALEEAKKTFDKADKESSLDFIYKMEEGTEQSDPSLRKVARTLREILDTKRNEVIALGTGKLENFIENYFPHVWESPNKAMNVFKSMMGKRPFEGSKSFLKKRTIPTTREGVENGLTPVSYNPIDSVMIKVREMNRYLMAHRSINALKEQGLIKFVPVGKEAPENFVKIDDRFADVTSKNDAGEMVIRGKYMAQKDAARILNNYLSPGLSGKSYIYDMYRGAGNTLNQFQLGFTAFHLGFTSMETTVGKTALGINKLSTGDFAGALKEFAKAPTAPLTNILSGDKLNRAWMGKDEGTLYNTVADIMATAGGRAKMDKFYATGAKESMMKALKEGKIATGALKVPYYIVEQMARPIMEYVVPRQKMGIFMDMIKMEMERNPAMTHQEMRGIAQRAWDSVDNRMGQMVYDNLFWNKTVKDLGMASVRSLGWNLGTIREIGGGTKDVLGNLDDIVHGRSSQLSYRTAYVMALPIVTGLYGAIYQYLHTGKGPQELKDYYFPKNGAIDNKGQESRVSLPTYMKDIYHYTTNPVQTVINKFSPVNNAVLQMLTNKDFYGTEIRNTDDPIIQQIIDESKFLGSQFVPFGFRNLNKDTRTSAGSKLEPFIGITPAPYDINMTAAEKEAYELEKGKIPLGSRTKSQATHSQNKAKLRSDFMASKDEEPLNDAVSQGVITAKEKKTLVKEAGMSNLQRMTQHLTFEEVAHIMKKASPAEKEELQNILDKKKTGKQRRGTWTKEEEDQYAKEFKS